LRAVNFSFKQIAFVSSQMVINWAAYVLTAGKMTTQLKEILRWKIFIG